MSQIRETAWVSAGELDPNQRYKGQYKKIDEDKYFSKDYPSQSFTRDAMLKYGLTNTVARLDVLFCKANPQTCIKTSDDQIKARNIELEAARDKRETAEEAYESKKNNPPKLSAGRDRASRIQNDLTIETYNSELKVLLEKRNEARKAEKEAKINLGYTSRRFKTYVLLSSNKVLIIILIFTIAYAAGSFATVSMYQRGIETSSIWRNVNIGIACLALIWLLAIITSRFIEQKPLNKPAYLSIIGIIYMLALSVPEVIDNKFFYYNLIMGTSLG